MIKILAAIAFVAMALPGCALRVGHAEAVIDVPDVLVEVPIEFRNRPHLTRHGVRNGTRYCHYSDGRVTERHYRYDCPYTY